MNWITTFIILCTACSSHGGCPWQNPVWVSSVNSAPTVELSPGRVVTISMTLDQVEENSSCLDTIDFGVANRRIEKRICSNTRDRGRERGEEEKERYICLLDLSRRKYCDEEFDFWTTLVNTNHSRGYQRIRSYAVTRLTLRCDGASTIEQMESPSCYAVNPTWLSGPLLEEKGASQIGLSWDVNQISNFECVASFSLKFWKTGEFNPKYKKLQFNLDPDVTRYGGKIDVSQCTSYSFIVTALTITGGSVNSIGSMKMPCPSDSSQSSVSLPSFTLEDELAVKRVESAGGFSPEFTQDAEASNILSNSVDELEIGAELEVNGVSVSEQRRRIGDVGASDSDHLEDEYGPREAFQQEIFGQQNTNPRRAPVTKNQEGSKIICWEDKKGNITLKGQTTKDDAMFSLLQENLTYSCSGDGAQIAQGPLAISLRSGLSDSPTTRGSLFHILAAVTAVRLAASPN